MKYLLNLTLICIASIFLIACEKENNIDYSDHEASIHVFVMNPYSVNTSQTILSNQKVYIKEKGSDVFLFEMSSDEAGQVDFSLLEKGKTYVAYAEKTIDSLPFKGEVEFNLGDTQVELLLTPDETQFNGFQIVCLDNLGARVPTVDICLFESQILAATNDCTISTYSGVSDMHGTFFMTRLVPNTYHISIVDTVGGIPVDYQGTIDVMETGVTTKNITVIP